MEKYSKLKWAIGFLLFALAISLRTNGLSHDLHLGKVYHPDTPKQMRAVERFVQGEYYTVLGGRDYEGYPLFNSHIVARFIRVYNGAQTILLRHLGLPAETRTPDFLTLFWITRILNATLSAGAVGIVFLIGWRWIAPAAGIISGLCLAFSPVDIVSCHYASGDSTAAFFAWIGVYLALETLNSPSAKTYVIAGLVTAAAFSSKYHGGIAVCSVGVAHGVHYIQRRALFSKASVGGAFLFLASLLFGVLLTSPALLVYPKGALHDILQFLNYTASFGMTAEMREMSLPGRFALGMRENLPVLVNSVGLIPAIAALVALALGRRHPHIWIIASVPILYILIGLSTKPLTHAVYHTMAIPGILLLTGYTLHQVSCGIRAQGARRLVALGLATVAVGYLAVQSRRELFFFNHNDTRYLAETWARNTIPTSFQLIASPYTFSNAFWNSASSSQSQGKAFVFSGRTGVHPPPDSIPYHTFDFETKKRIAFRNWPQDFFLSDTPLVSRMGSRPGLQPIPAPQPVNLIDADAPWYVRHPSTWTLQDREEKKGTLTKRQPPEHAAWFVRNGSEPSQLRLHLGGTEQRLRLDPGETVVKKIENLSPLRLTSTNRSFYSWRLCSEFGASRVSLLTSPRDVAWAHFHAGQFNESILSLQKVPTTAWTAGDRILHDICALVTGSSPLMHEEGGWVSLYNDYGVSPNFLSQLPGLTIEQGAWKSVPVTHPVSGEYLFDEYRLPDLTLDPGMYILEIETSTADADAVLIVSDNLDRPREMRTFPPRMPSGGALAIQFAVEGLHENLRLKIRFKDGDGRLTVRSGQIKPVPENTLNSYRALLALMRGKPSPTIPMERFWYSPLLAYAERLERGGHLALAMQMYQNAATAAPHRRKALQRLVELSEPGRASGEKMDSYLALFEGTASSRIVHSLHGVRFNNGVELTGYQLSPVKVNAGDSFGFLTHWRVEHLDRNLRQQSVWLHAIPEGGGDYAFQASYPLPTLLSAARPNEDALFPAFIQVRVPPETPPGRYTLNTGLWIRSQRKYIRVVSPKVHPPRKGIQLTTIEVMNDPTKGRR